MLRLVEEEAIQINTGIIRLLVRTENRSIPSQLLQQFRMPNSICRSNRLTITTTPFNI